MKTLAVKITGIRPMLMHNGLMADPTNKLVRQIKAIVSKGSKKMTDDDYERRDRLEWEAGLYWSTEHGPVVPSANIERCIQLGAQKSRRGKDFAAAVFCVEGEVPVQHEALAAAFGKGKPDMEKMYNEPNKRFIFRAGVVVQKSRLIRVRPMIPTGWKLAFNLEYDESIVNEKDITTAITDAGALIGLSDWRPKFGRFIMEK